MDKNKRLIIAVVVLILLCCCCLVLVGGFYAFNKQISEILQSIQAVPK
ncbi:MAG: hypothetical protein HY783_04410 [Chloroflexi bacterium]|nr:hypothetical protein [Chloroflexota bacterium]